MEKGEEGKKEKKKPNEKCTSAPTVHFPWDTETLRRVWLLEHPGEEAPSSRDDLCKEFHKSEELYKRLLKVKSRQAAVEEHSKRIEAKRKAKEENIKAKRSSKEAQLKQKQLKKELKELGKKEREKKGVEKKKLNPWQEKGLMPFSDETKKQIKEILNEGRSRQIKNDWKKIYEKFVDKIVSSHTMDFDDPASKIVPTFEFPWGAQDRESKSVPTSPPKYDFLKADRQFMDLNVCLNNYTIFVPWEPRLIEHFLKALVPDENVGEDDRSIRMSLLRHWDSNDVLRAYVSNLPTVPTSKLTVTQIAPLGTLLLAYMDYPEREFTDTQLENLWANDMLVRSYDIHKYSYGTAALTFYTLLTNIDKYKLYDTNGGMYLLDDDDIVNLQRRNLEFRKVPGKALQYVVSQAATLAKEGSEAMRSVLKRMHGIMHAVSFFMNSLFLIDPKFRMHVSTRMGQIESFRMLYLDEHKRGGNINAKDVKKWVQDERPDSLVPVFVKDSRVLVNTYIPPMLADTSKRFQQFIDNTWSSLRLPPVTDTPEKSECNSNARPGKHFIEPDNTQRFMNEEFTPASFENGRIIVHSVGSGKTCLAIRVASEFARAGFRILWVTKHSLRNQVLKNHVSEICNLLIRDQYENLETFHGKVAAEKWLQSLPKQTSFQMVLKTLQSLGMDWNNMSYRQFSNAINEQNETGRSWRKVAERIAFSDKKVDVLFKTLVIVDEAHKMFTGELDRTELPDVSAIHKALQHSYRTSMHNRCRVLFMTATPTTDSVLPLLSMLNMLHSVDVFSHSMHTFDVTTDKDWVEHVQETRKKNQQAEYAVACEMFKNQCDKKNDEDEEEDDEQNETQKAMAYFDSRSITGATVFKPKELTNHLQEFWSNAFGLISYYDISADYSKFPRTEYARIILPSATRLQERRMVSEILTSKRDLKHQARRIRQISAWAKFESVGSDVRVPDAVDQEIIKENNSVTFFEPTVDDLNSRKEQLREAIEKERKSAPVMPDSYEKFKSDLQKVRADIEAEKSSLQEAKTPAQMGQHTKRMNKLLGLEKGLEESLAEMDARLQFHDTMKNVKIQFFEKRIARIDRQISKTSRIRGSRLPRKVVTEEPETEDEEEQEEQVVKKKPKRAKTKSKSRGEDDDDDEDDDSSVEIEYPDDLTDQIEKGIKGEFSVNKVWMVVKDRLPNEKPKHPKCHYFDQPETFDEKRFRDDMPLYSPKAAKFIEIVKADDHDCLKHNPEDSERERHRKRLVFCQDIHDIRAVAGTLMAHGWTFGMKRQWVKWKKQWLNPDTDKVLKTATQKQAQLTWLPSTEDGEDYKRFLVLTKSKLGGVSGSTLNEYSVQTIGAKGDEATYNHTNNLHGKDYRIIIIDRNFMEGIDLPSTYADLFDSVLSASDRTQIVGRISRFCGNSGLPFVPNFGWPQRVYRYDLKFRRMGLYMQDNQRERLGEVLRTPGRGFVDIIPEKYRDAFVDKLESNLFSPTELQILLDGNMEMQRIQKKTLDVYNALLEKVNIGLLLYAPAMRNISASKRDLEELLMDEDETADEYRRETTEEEKPNSKYQLRSTDAAMAKYNITESALMSFLVYHVRQFTKSTSYTLEDLRNPEFVRKYFYSNVADKMNSSPELLSVSVDYSFEVFKDLLKASVDKKSEQVHDIEERKRQQQENRDKKSIKRAVREYLQKAEKTIKKADSDTVWDWIRKSNGFENRAMFDTVFNDMKASRKQKIVGEKSSSSEKSPQKTKSISEQAVDVFKMFAANLELKKDQILKNKNVHENFINAAYEYNDAFKEHKNEVEKGLKMYLEEIRLQKEKQKEKQIKKKETAPKEAIDLFKDYQKSKELKIDAIRKSVALQQELKDFASESIQDKEKVDQELVKFLAKRAYTKK